MAVHIKILIGLIAGARNVLDFRPERAGELPSADLAAACSPS